jgi:hypothetical protein
MKNADQVIAGIWNVLKSGGRFTAEFGGKGNVDIIVNRRLRCLADRLAGMLKTLTLGIFPASVNTAVCLSSRKALACSVIRKRIIHNKKTANYSLSLLYSQIKLFRLLYQLSRILRIPQRS